MKKRTDGRYQTSVVVGLNEDGSPRRKYVYGKTIKETNEKANALKMNTANGLKVDGITIRELGELWFELEKAPVLRASTLKSIRNTLNALYSFVGDIDVRDLRAVHLDRIKRDLIGKEEYATYNEVLSKLRAILNFGVTHDYVMRNITLGVKRVNAPKKVTKRPFTASELQAIENADLEPADRLMIDILRYSGMRRGEALALVIADIDLLRHEVRVAKNLVLEKVITDTKTAAGNRVIPLPQIFFDRNEAYIRTRRPFESILMTRGYRPMSLSAFSSHMKRDLAPQIFGDQIPEGFSAHMFRHNYASELYRSGLMKNDIKMAQYILGHADVKTTLNVYTHFDRDRLDRSFIDNFYSDDVKKMSTLRDRSSKMA